MARRTPRAGKRRPVEASSTEPVDAHAKARQICLQLLTSKARTRAELATALARRGIDDDTANEVLARFSEVGLIDDTAFAESYVHSGHTYRGLGRRALASQLRRRGVDEQTAGAAVAAVDPDAEERMARALVRRRIPDAWGAGTPDADGQDGTGTQDAGTRAADGRDADGRDADGRQDVSGRDAAAAELALIRKLVGMLARRGYPEGLSYRVVREELRAAGRDAALLDGADAD